MSSQSLTRPFEAAWNNPGLPQAARRLATLNWPLTISVTVSLALLVVAALGWIFDPRVITGAPAWAKPMKFAVSFAIYCSTFTWLLGFVRGHLRLAAVAGGATALGAVAELAIITLQVVRGAASHFNIGTPFDALLWSWMGNFAFLLWGMNLLLIGLLIFQRLPDPPFAWALRLGVLISTVGMGVGILMTSQDSPAQRALIEAGQPRAASGAHSVGVEDGGPGLPFLGWSTEGGDLRVAHFFGLHGLQVLPLAGYLINRFGARKLGRGHRLALVWMAAGAYLGWVVLLTWQALRGQSVIAPDVTTLTAFGGLAAAAALLAGLVLTHARASRPVLAS
jgi:hypothetical protein